MSIKITVQTGIEFLYLRWALVWIDEVGERVK